jgi:hypothetical protein
LIAYEKFPEPRDVEELKVSANKKELGVAFKKDAKAIAEALESLPEDEAECLRKTLESGGWVGGMCLVVLAGGVVDKGWRLWVCDLPRKQVCWWVTAMFALRWGGKGCRLEEMCFSAYGEGAETRWRSVT